MTENLSPLAATARVREFHRALECDIERVRIYTRDLDLESAHRLCRELDLTRDSARSLERDLDAALPFAQHVRMSSVRRTFVIALVRLGIDRIIRDIGLARDCAQDLVAVLTPRTIDDVARNQVDRVASVLIGNLTLARMNSQLLARRLIGIVEPWAKFGRNVLVNKTARRLALFSLLLLPASARARYGEEWESELYELAVGDQPRRRQMVHALRIAVRAMSLRSAARQPIRETTL